MTGSLSVAELEDRITGKGFVLTKDYDNLKGICKVSAEKGRTTIKAQNTTKAPLWRAYHRALEFIYSDILAYEKQVGRSL